MASTTPLLIRGGTVVNHDQSFRADVLCENGRITAVGENLKAPAEARVIDATGKLVLPGGIDPHTHMQMPFMGTVTVDDFESGTGAALAGGTTMIIDFVIPKPGESLIAAYDVWREWGKKSCCDFSLHVAVTWWGDQVREEMGILARERGVNSFKHFLAYKGALMLEDEALVSAFMRAKELGCLPSVHAENGELVLRCQRKLLERGVTGPEGHPLSRPPAVEAEATDRACRVAQVLNNPVYVVHCTCKEAVDVAARAQADGQRVYVECIAGHLSVDDAVYWDKDWGKAAAHVLSPPFRPKSDVAALWKAIQAGVVKTTGSDNCTFLYEQKRAGRNDFSKIPNGTNGVEDRMSVLWHCGVTSGLISPNEFVGITAANAAQIFNIYPRKGFIGVGSDADIVVWDPEATRTISAKTHHQKVDVNIWEGWTVTGIPLVTVSRGKVVWENGKLMAKPGWGEYIDRPTFGPPFNGVAIRDKLLEAKPVLRE